LVAINAASRHRIRVFIVCAAFSARCGSDLACRKV
jgi:hypothetical protein